MLLFQRKKPVMGSGKECVTKGPQKVSTKLSQVL